MRGRSLLSVVALAGIAAVAAMPGLSLPRQYLPPPKPPKPINRERMAKAQEKRERRALRNLRNAGLPGEDGLANRVDRLKAIGNGQVPRVAATAFGLLGAAP